MENNQERLSAAAVAQTSQTNCASCRLRAMKICSRNPNFRDSGACWEARRALLLHHILGITMRASIFPTLRPKIVLIYLLYTCTLVAALAPSSSAGGSFGGDRVTTSGRSAADELASLTLPTKPCASLAPEDVAVAVFRGLQHNNVPQKDTGYERAFNFCSWECRKAVTARRGADTLDRFVEFSDVLLPFLNAVKVAVEKPPEGIKVTPGTPTRGALCFVRVNAYTSKMVVPGGEGNEDDASLVPTSFVVQLQQERRPPLQGMWLIREITDVRHAFAGDAGVDTSE